MPNCSRRSLLQMTCVLAAGNAVQLLARPLVLSSQPADRHPRGTRLYAALRASSGRPAGIGTFVWSGEAWQSQSFLPAPNVGPLIADAGGKLLFAAHSGGDSGLPAGFVETLHVNPKTGGLSRGQRQSLALASRNPVAMALSPDHHLMAVVAEGGVFSLLPVQTDGTLQEVSAAYKQLALSTQAKTALSLSFRNVVGPGSNSMKTTQSMLILRTDHRCLEYECETTGLTLAGTSETRTRPIAIAAAPPLPSGTRSYVLQLPLRA